MGYAKYVGRVGGLAVALGVGVAVATTPGVAWAGPETGSTGTSTSDTSDSTTGTAGPTSTGPSDVIGGGSGTGDGSAGSDESGDAGDSAGSSEEMKVDSSGGPITSTTAGSAGAAQGDDGEDSGADTAPEPTTVAKPKPAGKSGSDLSASSAPKAPKRLSVTTEAAVSRETKAGSSTQRVGAVEDSVGQPSGSSAAQVPVQRSAVPTALTDGTASDRAVQALVSAPAAPNSTVSRWMSTMLSAGAGAVGRR